MKWSIAEENGSFFILVNGMRALTENHKKNVVEAASLGNRSKEIWFRFKDEKNGKRLMMDDFEESRQSIMSEKLKLCQCSSTFVKELQAFGVKILTRHRVQKGKSNTSTGMPQYPDVDPSPSYADMFAGKLTGTDVVDLAGLEPAPPHLQLRRISQEWVTTIKKRWRAAGADIGFTTRIPVTRKDKGFICVGGNHVREAARQLLEEDPDRFSHLRKVTVDVYADLSDEEIIRLAAVHNCMTDTRKLLFQDRVKLARQIKDSTGQQWKTEVATTMSLLDGKNYSNDSLTTLFATANLNEECWSAAEALFEEYELTSNSSYPVQLFRSLQAIRSDDIKAKYLKAAAGTNGIKTARQISVDKKRENVKDLATVILGTKDWDELTEKVGADKAGVISDYNGNLTSTDGRQSFKNFILRTRDRETSLKLRLELNGQDISSAHEAVLSRYLKRIKEELKLEE